MPPDYHDLFPWCLLWCSRATCLRCLTRPIHIHYAAQCLLFFSDIQPTSPITSLLALGSILLHSSTVSYPAICHAVFRLYSPLTSTRHDKGCMVMLSPSAICSLPSRSQSIQCSHSIPCSRSIHNTHTPPSRKKTCSNTYTHLLSARASPPSFSRVT